MVAPVSSETWLATLREVSTQAALLQPTELAFYREGGSFTGSDWVTVDAPAGPRQQTADSEEGSSVWPPQQWQIAFEILFCQAPSLLAVRRPHQDDLLFFVLTEEAQATAATAPNATPSPLFVRRASLKQPQLPADLQWGGAACGRVDWRASLLLNLVMQTGFCLSVATCKKDDLALLVSGEHAGTASSSSINEVTRQVHPSPSKVPVNMDDSRSQSERPAVAYPDICFAVENFADAFQSLVLSDPEDCYCVLLHADVVSSWRIAEEQPGARGSSNNGAAVNEGASSSSSSPAQGPEVTIAADALAGLGLEDRRPTAEASANSSRASTSQQAGAKQQPGAGVQARGQDDGCPAREVLVFSGFVSHAQLAAAMSSKPADPLRRLFRDPSRPDVSRVLMRGPEGQGSADVVVTSEGQAGAAAGAEGQQPRPKLMQRASFVARGLLSAARQAAQGGAGGAPAGTPQQLSCALMTLLVPVGMLASAILDAL